MGTLGNYTKFCTLRNVFTRLRRRKRYRMQLMQALVFRVIIGYYRKWRDFPRTEATEKRSISYYATKETYRAPDGHTPARHRDLLGQASRRIVGTQYGHHLRGDQNGQAPRTEDGQAVSDYTRSGAGIFREFAGRKRAEVNRRYTSCIPACRHKNSVSSQVWRPHGTDAAKDKPCLNCTHSPPCRQLGSRGRPLPLHLSVLTPYCPL